MYQIEPRFLTQFSIRVCLVGVKTERMKNKERKIGWKMLFFTVWLRKENKRERKQGRKFSLPAHFFYPLKLGGKWGGKSAMKCILYKYPITYPSLYSWPDNFCLFSSLSLYLLTSQQRPGSLLSLFFSLFNQHNNVFVGIIIIKIII